MKCRGNRFHNFEMGSKKLAVSTSDRDIKKSRLTRQRIVAAAARTLARCGYAHTRLTDIAKEANSYAGGIYYYFPSRSDLVEEVLSIATQRTINSIQTRLAKLPKDASTRQIVSAAIAAQLAETHSDEPYAAAFFKIYPQIPQDLRERHQPVLKGFFDLWRKIITNGQNCGDIRRDIRPSVMRFSIIGAVQWFGEWSDSNRAAPERLASEISRILFEGIGSENKHVG